MFKKSIARIDNESSQSELSNPALHDIIATNHVTYPKVIISISKMNLYFFFSRFLEITRTTFVSGVQSNAHHDYSCVSFDRYYYCNIGSCT